MLGRIASLQIVVRYILSAALVAWKSTLLGVEKKILGNIFGFNPYVIHNNFYFETYRILLKNILWQMPRMLRELGGQVAEIISFVSLPPCPWDGMEDDVSSADLVLSRDSKRNILAKMEELLDLLKRLKSCSSSGSILSVASTTKAVPMNGFLVEEINESSHQDELQSIGRDVLLHVVGLYSVWHAGVAQNPALGKVLLEIRELLEICDGTCALADRAMPDILEEVHKVVVAHVNFEQMSCVSVSLMQYKGPNDWERYLRSIELMWLLDNISYEQTTVDERMMVCRTIALGCKDVSYHVRNMCLEAFIVLIRRLDTCSMLQEHEATLSDVLMSCLAANDERCWDCTYRAVSCMILAQSLYTRDKLLGRSIEQAYRNGTSLIFASSWLRAMRPCFESAGISLMQYFTMLLPTLIEWVQCLHEDVQIMSLDALNTCLRICWPRNHAHAHSLWETLQEIYTRMSPEISGKVSQVAELIWVTSGDDFRSKMRHHTPRSELTSIIMNRLDTEPLIKTL